MPHRVGPVSDHDTVHAGCDLLADRLRELDILLLRHIFGENAEEFLRGQVADVGKFGNRPVQFSRRECGDDRARAVIQPGGDRAARAQKRHPGRLGLTGNSFSGIL